MSIAFRVSRPGYNADTHDPKELGFSSEYYMHSIGKTEFRQTSGSEQMVSHIFGYIPILFSYCEDPNNANDYMWAGFSALTGSDRNRIRLAFASGKKVRYYALHQGI